jgi:hypothetical protein
MPDIWASKSQVPSVEHRPLEMAVKNIACLKVPRREIFVTELFILSDPIWVGDLRTEPKKPFV